MAPSAQSSDAYLPALDGLRAVAILLVLASHMGLEHVVPGAFGVTLFFFISGYLITRQLLHGIALNGRIDFAGFYLRRALRLLPAGLAYVLIAGTIYRFAGGEITLPGWLSALFYGANIYDLWEGYRSTLPGVRHPFNILWSLAIEEHFYALWPLILAALPSRRAAIGAVLLICLTALLWRQHLFTACDPNHVSALCGRLQPNPAWRFNRLYQGTDTRIDSIAWGALLALIPHRIPTSRALQIAALTLLAASFFLPGPFARQVLRTTLQGAALLILVPAILTQDHAIRRALSTTPAILIGRLSYSLYLWHWGALAIADHVAPTDPALWLLIALPLSTILAAASYLCIERPMLRLRRHFGSHVPTTLEPIKPGETLNAAS